MEMKIRFPGGLAVEALFAGFTVPTDQPIAQGGSGRDPSPFDLFLASLGTCAGTYALRFCQERGIDTRALRMSLRTDSEPEGGRIATIRIQIDLPPDFPDKYRTAIVRAAERCAVKRYLQDPPRVEFTAAVPEAWAAAAPLLV